MATQVFLILGLIVLGFATKLWIAVAAIFILTGLILAVNSKFRQLEAATKAHIDKKFS